MPSTNVKIPSASESTLMSAILEHHDGPLNVDWEGVAQTMGYKNGQVASDRFRQVKKKLGWGSGSTANMGSTPSRSKVGKARAAPARPRAQAVASRKSAPAKKATNTKPRVAMTKPKSVEQDADGDEEGVEAEAEAKDIIAGSEDDNADPVMSFEEKFNRGDYADDYKSDSESGNLSDSGVAELQRQIPEGELQKQNTEQVYDDYDAYEDEFEDAKEEVATEANTARPHCNTPDPTLN